MDKWFDLDSKRRGSSQPDERRKMTDHKQSQERSGNGLFRKISMFLVLRMALGSVFLYASVGKIMHPEVFAETISNYQLLPGYLINITAIVLPWVELLVGAGLLVGVLLPGSLFVANLLLSIFLCALVAAFVRGLNIECGCFNTSVHSLAKGSMGWYLVRDAVFLGLGFYLFTKICLRTSDSRAQSP